ncbi:MAG TPA: hypothetical protein VND45_06005 [Thermoanaerobaculia bacterium]|nr:hypothetical protein [Thermoanaerobaculia bacterium]
MRARYVLAAFLALFAILTLVDRFVLVELLILRTGVPLLVACVVAAGCAGLGRFARRAPRDLPLDFVIGYPLLGTACFLIGLLKVNVWTTGAVVLAACALNTNVGRASARPTAGRAEAPPTFAAIAVAAVLACGFVAAQAPPTSLDELAYHLAVPHTWVLEGRAVELPLLSHSYFPLGIESADLPALALLGAAEGGVASHLLHLIAAIATVWLIARRTQSWLLTAAIATTPALAITAGWSLVDWPLAGLFVAMLEEDDPSAATAAGLLTKYTFAPFALLVWVVRRRRPHWIALAGLVFYVRNFILTWNPFAPFFGADAPHVAGFRELALADYIFDPAFIDEALGAAILILPAFAFGAVAIGSAAIAVALFFLAPSSRILVPYLIAPAMSAGEAVKSRWVAIVVGIAVVVQTFLVVWFTARGGAFSLLAGGASEEDYLREQRANYGSIEWLNRSLPADARALVIGTGETYWFTKRVRGGGNFDGPRVSRYLDMHAPEALHARLKRDGITHVAVIAAPVPTKNAQKVEERQTTLSPTAQRMLARTLDAYAASVTSRGDATLFTLR